MKLNQKTHIYQQLDYNLKVIHGIHTLILMHQSPLLREILQQPGVNQKTLNGKLRFMERDGQLP